jgi:hypothetical protein
MLKDDTLINAASILPETDAGCVSTCYYVGYDFDHDHGGGGGGGCLTNGEDSNSLTTNVVTPC